MGFDQYHEPPAELSAQTRTLVRMLSNLTEEAEAISWYMQRMSVETDASARAIMDNALGEEYKHFSMDLEFLLRKIPKWRSIAAGVVLESGDIVDNAEAAEEGADDSDSAPGMRDTGSLGIGSLKK